MDFCQGLIRYPAAYLPKYLFPYRKISHLPRWMAVRLIDFCRVPRLPHLCPACPACLAASLAPLVPRLSHLPHLPRLSHLLLCLTYIAFPTCLTYPLVPRLCPACAALPHLCPACAQLVPHLCPFPFSIRCLLNWGPLGCPFSWRNGEAYFLNFVYIFRGFTDWKYLLETFCIYSSHILNLLNISKKFID